MLKEYFIQTESYWILQILSQARSSTENTDKFLCFYRLGLRVYLALRKWRGSILTSITLMKNMLWVVPAWYERGPHTRPNALPVHVRMQHSGD